MSAFSLKDTRLGLYWFLAGVIAAALAVSFYKYFFRQDYMFLLEAPCDTAIQTCYVRDCSTGECPPNGLAAYRIFELKASRFTDCEDAACLNLCPGDSCGEVFCDTREGLECTVPENTL